MEKKIVSRITLAKVFLRSFLFQSSWNFERLQNMGALYTIAPALRQLYRGKELADAYRRHLDYFNTHPFLASPVLGSVIALEEEAARGESAALSVQEYKGMIMAPYAAIGDALFWGGLRPLAAGISLFFAAKGSLWAPVVFLLFFNLPHLWFRTVGLLRGYRQGMRIVEVMQRRRLPDLAIRLKEGTVVLLGGLCAYLAYLQLEGESLSPGWGLCIPLVVSLFGWLVRRGTSVLLLVLAVAFGMVMLGQFG
ncbi:MAG: PTS mannose transporter subunit IIA [Desulfuromonas sp.]|uniref:PTS system mannose/fructose/sorbose family transporter subunit IID n=1 Tax=Desulfuromonas sp. TaxID=892 RepID=UPI000CBCB956|nr:PTS system mannose/fructose/sorbose family transporter subunit IID [Desulfuromonas sp.]PLX86019.1 MAG: PTS mannose transporter subunit IIA [Desulfuromonas sp.]